MKRKRRTIGEFIADGLDFPDTLSANAPDIHIVGTREIAIDGCLGILVYEREEIVLRLRERILCICGEELTLKTYYTGHVSVRGRISSVSFEEG
ncbi:MAG: YabP/YqfC family sporulation protein, partial [Clostridia bacterium]|nr:YabP/YqfC family sporulation protein [Clostridia bacterium]